MAYELEVIKKDEFKTSNWSGGTTTQLYIYPKDSIYSERNFKWRLSSAKVETEQSDFTSLPGIARIIMIIEGNLKLEHEGHHKVTLDAFQQDSFKGEWKTKSFGKVTDFNLMMNNQCSGELEAIFIEGKEMKDILLNDSKENNENVTLTTEAFYIVQGNIIIISQQSNTTQLNQGDLLLITTQTKDNKSKDKLINEQVQFINELDETVKIIRAIIHYCDDTKVIENM